MSNPSASPNSPQSKSIVSPPKISSIPYPCEYTSTPLTQRALYRPDSPQMLTGPIEGRFLELLVHALAPKRVLELGTYSGYSSISMAAGLPEGGHIDTREFDETHAEVARRYVGQSPYADRITVHVGPALETIKQLEGDFDFVFVDADKENYLNYYEALLPRLAEGGLMALDNTLWSGRVLDDSDDSEYGSLADDPYDD